MSSDEETKQSFTAELINLIKQGKCEEVLELINSNETVDELIDADGTQTFILHLAAKYYNTKLINVLIESGCDLDNEDSSGMTPLMLALAHENFEAVEILHEAQIQNFVGQSEATNHQRDELKKQVRSCLRDEIVSMAREVGLSSRKIGRLLAKLYTYLIDVAKYHDPVMTKAYLKSSTIDAWGADKVMALVVSQYDLEHIQVLTSHGCGWEIRSSELFHTLVLNEISEYHENKRERNFLHKIFSWDRFDEKHLESLEKALMIARISSVKVFLQYGLNTMTKVKYNRDILACLFGNRDQNVVSLLNQDSLDVDGRGYNGNTPLHFAIENKLLDNVRFLLDRGADPHVPNKEQRTPLGLAITVNEDEKLVRLLLLAGANPLLVQDLPFGEPDYFSPQNYLEERRHLNIIELVAARVAIFEASGLSLKNPLKTYLEYPDYVLKSFYEECGKQLEELKERKIGDTHLTMFEVIAENPVKLTRYLDDEDLQMIVDLAENSEDKLNSYYRDTLKKRAKDIARMRVCRDRAIEIVCEFYGVDRNHLVIDRIIGYLGYRDLVKFEFYDLKELTSCSEKTV